MSDPDPAGYRMPGEFEPHEATWMAWPHDERTWIRGLEAAEDAFLAMIEALSHGERVDLLVRPEDRERAEDRLSTRSVGEVRLHEKDHADAWLRDTGPTVLVDDGQRLAVDWRFDAWGGKYEDLKRDDDIAAFVADRLDIPRVRVDMECEGGAIDADGRGRVLTTASCLVDGRGHERGQVEELFARVLGAEETVWLDGGLAGDDTDGHVDTVARFLDPGTVALATPGDTSQPHDDALEANQETLAAHEELDIVELPQPGPVHLRGQPRPATYANFYVGNDTVLVPTYGDANDEIACRRLDEAIDREIVPIDAEALIAGYGACHCLTQPIPAP